MSCPLQSCPLQRPACQAWRCLPSAFKLRCAPSAAPNFRRQKLWAPEALGASSARFSGRVCGAVSRSARPFCPLRSAATLRETRCASKSKLYPSCGGPVRLLFLSLFLFRGNVVGLLPAAVLRPSLGQPRTFCGLAPEAGADVRALLGTHARRAWIGPFAC